MSLSIIGPGFGRTGTLSLKFALEQLGLGPCYHMMEVFGRAEHVAMWTDAANGRPVDWETVFAGFKATVDWPACAFWRELIVRYPQAKVVLTERDPERWYESAYNTIYQAMIRPMPVDDPLSQQHRAMARKIVLENTFGGRFEDRAYAITVFQRHNEAVRREVPAARLLVYEVGAGWEPLCRFLGVPVPSEPFPRVNSTEEFRSRFMFDAPPES